MATSDYLSIRRVRKSAAADIDATKRVLIYGINYSPEPIGVGRYTGELGAYLSGEGMTVEVVTAVPHYPGWSLRDGYRNRYVAQRSGHISIMRCPLFLKRPCSGFWRLVAPLSFAITSAPVVFWRILATRPDTVLCVEPTLFCAPVALFAARLIAARTVLHIQDLELDAAFAVGHLRAGALARAGRWFERIILRRFDGIVTISKRMRGKIEEKGVSPNKIVVVRNWVDLMKIKPMPTGWSRFRDALNIPQDAFVLLYSGNIGPKQALPLVLDAAVRLADRKGLIFVIAGEGPDKKKLMEDHGHLPNVRFLPLQPEEHLGEFLSVASVHILPQLAGTADLVLPSKLGGMLASGKLCIVMADEGTELHEFLSGTALLVPPGDIVALCDSIILASEGVFTANVARQSEVVQWLTAEKNLPALSRAIFATGDHAQARSESPIDDAQDTACYSVGLDPAAQPETSVRGAAGGNAEIDKPKMSATKLNAVANYLNFVVFALLGLLINPLLVSYLGAATFGLWKICLRVLDFATATDGRATQALKWVVAFRTSDGEIDRKKREVGASIAIWAMWLPILLAVIAVLIYSLPMAISGITPHEAAIVRWAGAILGANIVLSALFGIPDAVLVGENQGYRSTVITTVFLVASNCAMVIAAWLHCHLTVLAIIVLTSAGLNGLFTWMVARKKIAWWGVHMPSWFDIKQLFGFSSWTMLGTLVQTLLLSSELLLFSVLGGAVAVTNFTFTSYAVQFALSICLMTGSAIAPRLGALVGASRLLEAGILVTQTREVVLAIVAVSGSAILLFNGEFVSLWGGPQRYLGGTVNALMVAVFFQLALIRCDSQIQDVGLKIREKVLMGLFASLLSIVFGWVAYRYIAGFVGMYCGILLGRLIASISFPILIGKMVVGASYSPRSVAATLLVLTCSYAVGLHLNADGWYHLIFEIVLAIPLLSAFSYAAILSSPTREKIIQMKLLSAA